MIQKTLKTKTQSNNAGFTLIELAVVLVIISVLAAITMGAGSKLIKWQKDTETKNNLNTLQNGLQQIYQSSAWVMDSSASNTVSFNVLGTTYTLSTGSSATAQNQAALGAIAQYAGGAFSMAAHDAMNENYQIYVTPRLIDNTTGAQFHSIGIVSPGWDGKIGSIWNSTTGILTVQGDDEGIYVSGLQYEAANIIAAKTMLYGIRDAYQNYFTSLYLADSNRNVYVDRFAFTNTSCASDAYWDSTSGVKNSACTAPSNTADNTGLTNTLGYSPTSVTTPWGREILVDNSSNSTRNPNSTGVILPYTARLSAELPWGGTLDVTVNGAY